MPSFASTVRWWLSKLLAVFLLPSGLAGAFGFPSDYRVWYQCLRSHGHACDSIRAAVPWSIGGFAALPWDGWRFLSVALAVVGILLLAWPPGRVRPVTTSQRRDPTYRPGGGLSHAYENDHLILGLPWTATELNANGHVERMSSLNTFSIVASDGTVVKYKRPDLDEMSEVQRKRLFGVDPEIKTWWQGYRDGARNRFRLPGGYWVHKNLLSRADDEARQKLWSHFPDLLEWYLEGKQF